ncbi:major facilitator superfamily mfs_1 [Stylonychia lemnae]|uniref:Major facilitator superfamily mfs_1 n=1 Tax=Stylonychia lemnae TaxID=5949 RepID=A0A078B3D0_STYLE|nr:major facilitator superfamily mfs_1 [Stylonychia lemnae]|eukprot:CDW88766.1 major facilitator superfamily mfs_1 [Stylonychia lemnae]
MEQLGNSQKASFIALHKCIKNNTQEGIIRCQPQTLFGIILKQRVSLMTGISIFIVSLMGNLAVTFFGTTANIVLKTQFNLNNDEELIQVSSIIYMITVITLAVVSPFVGGLCDILGRKKWMSILFISTAVLCSILPYSARIWIDFTIIRIILTIENNSMINNTLIADYVEKQSIGKAVIYNNFMRYLGNFMSPILFLNLIAHTSIKITYNIIAVLLFLTGVFLFISIREPLDQQQNFKLLIIKDSINNLNKLDQPLSYWSNIKNGLNECKNNPILIFCLIQNFVVRMGTVLSSNGYTLWILSNIQDQKQAFELLAFALALSCALNFLIQIPLIKLLDKIRPKFLLCFAQLFRACALLMPLFIDNKCSKQVSANIVLMSLGNGMTNVARDMIFQKNQAAQLHFQNLEEQFQGLWTYFKMLEFQLIYLFSQYFLVLSDQKDASHSLVYVI